MFCNVCGKQLNQNENFCSNCGNSVVNQNMCYNQVNYPIQSEEDKQKTSSLVLGIVGLVLGNIICSIIAICLGASYSKKTGKTPAGLILGIIGTAFGVVVTLFVFWLFFMMCLYGY